MATNETDPELPQQLTHDQCVPGRLVNTDGPKSFKVGVIVGFTTAGKVRVCKWSHNSKAWTKPQSLWPRELHVIYSEKLSPRHRSVYNRALDSFVKLGVAKLVDGGGR